MTTFWNTDFRLPAVDASRDELIAYYHNLLYTAREIKGFLLFVHNIIVSEKTIYRVVRRLNLWRRSNESDLQDVIRCIVRLRSDGFSEVGYPSMWQLLNTRCGLHVTQETVRFAQIAIDRDGVNIRGRNRLRRRHYTIKGPHFCLHVDGYDKLKPFGIAIHGCIDGFSRKILWLNASHTNNPRYVAQYFVAYLKQLKRVPRMVRSDAGNENVIIRDIQIALRSSHGDEVAGHRSFSVGRSTSNQRIEMLWSFLMRYFTSYWRNLFIDIVDSGQLHNADPIHLECIRFCFMPIIQHHLNTFLISWNSHRIRPQRQIEIQTGVPDVMFFQPFLFDTTDYAFEIPCGHDVLDEIERVYTQPRLERGCSADFIGFVEEITGLNVDDFDAVASPDKAKQLFIEITGLIDALG
ncbi:uncharacterized protein LOC127711545 [Mytilus californianus]|uniref:uncharacterized protein LOC127711545 n=1 Tax=Mytilus californianus TaxID=6549 RepID=UPI0022453D32|nr:uncharacterized protein LOC127711545 [Mytilus californianus]